jgi:hypothetical protein
MRRQPDEARKFALRAVAKRNAICSESSRVPVLGAVLVSDNCNANIDSFASLCGTHTSDTGLDDDVVFTCSEYFQVREIDVFEITD